MSLHSRKNQYRGVNAHLHSILQNEHAGWQAFHGAYIIDLARAIDGKLPPGYIVAPETSLQIREIDPDTGKSASGKRRGLRPDIAVYDYEPASRTTTYGGSMDVTAPTLTLSLDMPEAPEDFLSAVVIHEIDQDTTLGRAVTRLEVLSPTNKPPGVGYVQYREKRAITLSEGIVMVEIDYLHQSPPIDKRVPNYLQDEAGSYPYCILVTDPRPTRHEGKTEVYGFEVDTPLPIINIPLSGNDEITVDFGEVYNQTFGSLSVFAHRVDYLEEPPRIETYRADDKVRIRARMRAVWRAAEHGLDLEQGPFEREAEG